jgi:hypothetical protein
MHISFDIIFTFILLNFTHLFHVCVLYFVYSLFLCLYIVLHLLIIFAHSFLTWNHILILTLISQFVYFDQFFICVLFINLSFIYSHCIHIYIIKKKYFILFIFIFISFIYSSFDQFFICVLFINLSFIYSHCIHIYIIKKKYFLKIKKKGDEHILGALVV